MKKIPAIQWLSDKNIFNLKSNNKKRRNQAQSSRLSRSLQAVELLEDRICLAVDGIDDFYTVAQGGTLTADDVDGTVTLGDPTDDGVAANDIDTLGVILQTNPTNGNLNFAADGTFTYTPTANFIGVDTFDYLAIGVTSTESLMNSTNSWDYFHPTDGIDPAIADTDFDTTWFGPAGGYDGPVFGDSGTGLFGYGTIDFGAITENIGTPANGDRFTAYFTSTFTLAASATNVIALEATILADDGAFIYINGVLAGNRNMGATTDTYEQLAANTTNTEIDLFVVSLDASLLVDGPNTIAVSLHNQGTGSSDLGFQMDSLVATVADPTESDSATVTITVNDADVAPVLVDSVYTIDQDTVLDTANDVTQTSPLQDSQLLDVNSVNGHEPFEPLVSIDVVNTIPAAAGILTFNTSPLAGNAGLGEITFTPTVGFFGTVEFTYTVTDNTTVVLPGDNVSNIATVTITVAPVNSVPVANPVSYDVDENQLLTAAFTVTPKIAAGSTWGYDDSNTDWSTELANRGLADWTALSFNVTDPDQGDTGGLGDLTPWDSGAAELGYGETEITTINFGPDPDNALNDPANKFTTYYFRNEFSLNTAEVADTTHLFISLKRDDGAAIYLNGEQIILDNLSNIFDHTTFAGGTITDDGQDFHEYVIPVSSLPPNTLIDGTNVIAVEIHQISLTSSDISFDLSLGLSSDFTAANTTGSGSSVLANSTDGENQGLTVILDTNVSNGVLNLNSDGTFTYQPTGNFAGVDNFTFFVSDGTDQSLTAATATITINNTIVDPTPIDDNYTAQEDVDLIVDVATGLLANEGGPLVFEINTFTQPTAGTGSVAVNSDGSFTYTHEPDYNGPASFTYTIKDLGGSPIAIPIVATVNINVLASVDPPSPAAVLDFNATEGGSVIVSSLATPIVTPAPLDEEFTPILISLPTAPANGVIDVSAFPTVSYIPNVNFHGVDSVTFTVETLAQTIFNTGSNWDYFHPTDGTDPDLADPDFDSTWFTRLIPGNSFDGPAWDGSTPLTIDSGNAPATFFYGAIGFNETTALTAPSSDVTDGGPADHRFTAYFTTSFELVDLSAGAQLTANILADDGAFIYINGVEVGRLNIPVEDPLAEDTYNYRTANGGNEASLTAVALDLSGVTLNEGTNYLSVSVHQTSSTSSDVGFDMSLDLSYSIEVTATVTVASVPGHLEGFDDAFTIAEDTLLTGENVMTNTTGIETGPVSAPNLITAIVDTGPSNALSFILNADGTFDYTPAAGFFGEDSFTYKLQDLDAGTDSAPITVTITVTPVNDGPVGADDSYSVAENGSFSTGPGTVGVSLIALDSVWDYDDKLDENNANASINTDWSAELTLRGLDDWTHINFDPADPDQLDTGGLGDLHAWSSGNAELGYGENFDDDNDPLTPAVPTEATVIDSSTKYATYYFRREFNILDAGALAAIGDDLLLTLEADDGAIVYLNGVEIFRSLMLDSADGHDDFTYKTVSELAFDNLTGLKTDLPLAHILDLSGSNPLVVGDNVIAVEVHQASLTSSDVSFNLGLKALTTVDDTRVLANDVDGDVNVENDLLTAVLVTGPTMHEDQGGTSPFVFNRDGSFSYNATLGTSYVDTFTYTLSDGTAADDVLVTVTITVGTVGIVGDIDGDGLVGLKDLLLLKKAFSTINAAADLDNSGGLADAADLAILLGNYGQTTPPPAPEAAAAQAASALVVSFTASQAGIAEDNVGGEETDPPSRISQLADRVLEKLGQIHDRVHDVIDNLQVPEHVADRLNAVHDRVEYVVDHVLENFDAEEFGNRVRDRIQNHRGHQHRKAKAFQALFGGLQDGGIF